ncbi:basic proline-rich protein-like [Ornithorhynchus anatinus]|uniref:basic proline-rich protein-like n=1 Tax=Ornithorhynchus anatinus TaxID=9258 RepID=UPI0010A79B4E|nr:basic proline-rich protein-like [Ornithorhynchus anatinus]
MAREEQAAGGKGTELGNPKDGSPGEIPGPPLRRYLSEPEPDLEVGDGPGEYRSAVPQHGGRSRGGDPRWLLPFSSAAGREPRGRRRGPGQDASSPPALASRGGRAFREGLRRGGETPRVSPSPGLRPPLRGGSRLPASPSPGLRHPAVNHPVRGQGTRTQTGRKVMRGTDPGEGGGGGKTEKISIVRAPGAPSGGGRTGRLGAPPPQPPPSPGRTDTHLTSPVRRAPRPPRSPQFLRWRVSAPRSRAPGRTRRLAPVSPPAAAPDPGTRPRAGPEPAGDRHTPAPLSSLLLPRGRPPLDAPSPGARRPLSGRPVLPIWDGRTPGPPFPGVPRQGGASPPPGPPEPPVPSSESRALGPPAAVRPGPPATGMGDEG